MKRFANVNEHDAKVLMKIEKIVGALFIEAEQEQILQSSVLRLRYVINKDRAVTSIAFHHISLDTAKIYKLLSNLDSLNNLTINNYEDGNLLDISPLSNLLNLQQLSLSNNKILDISPLSNLLNLQWLYLGGNQISDISHLSKLSNLQQLNLRHNQISDISHLSKLPNLQYLYLDLNKIINITPLSNLFNLKTLSLIDNQISDISPLSKLNNLQYLNLYINKITNILPLAGLSNLQHLWLNSNKITNIAPLSELFNLEFLRLDSNRIADISHLSNLPKLRSLNLSNNQISIIPQQLYKQVGNKNFFYKNNPITSPPLAVLEQGYEAVMNYFREIEEEGEARIYEAKLLVLGDGGAGKTTLIRKINDLNAEMPKLEDSTHGIQVSNYTFGCTDSNNTHTIDYKVHIWDFGGQEMYFSTHRYFLTEDSFYILVLDCREQRENFDMWLWTQKIYGKQSPLLILHNEKNKHHRKIPLSNYSPYFQNILKEDFSFNLQNLTAAEQNKIKKAIEYYIPQLPIIGKVVPASWLKVRELITEKVSDGYDYITVRDFAKLCEQVGIKRKSSIANLSKAFHNLGIFLHYTDNANLHSIIIINPQWAVRNTYKILDSSVKYKAGHFTKSDITELWQQADNMGDDLLLLQLMKGFSLIYEYQDKNTLRYIAPIWLPEAISSEHNIPSFTNKIQLYYKCDIPIPVGIFHKFIVQMHRYIPNSNWVSKYSVVLQFNNIQAFIQEFPLERKITIQLQGIDNYSNTDLRAFKTIIIERFDDLFATYIENGLKLEKYIPCICSQCAAPMYSDDVHFFKYTALLEKKKRNKTTTVDCDKSDESVKINALLEEYKNTPLVYGVFGNPKQDLDVKSEVEYIKKALSTSQDNEQIEMMLHNFFSTQQELIDDIERLGGRMTIFHFGGHADGSTILLDDNKPTFANGLQGLFKKLAQIKLVVLNGCATQAQVHGFLKAGVPLVIATSMTVDDEKAVHFSQYFYQSLAQGYPINVAFDDTLTKLKVLSDEIDERPHRRFITGIMDFESWQASKIVESWSLFINKDRDEEQNYRLVT